MSRWGKPTKNKRRRDPRYHLKEYKVNPNLASNSAFADAENYTPNPRPPEPAHCATIEGGCLHIDDVPSGGAYGSAINEPVVGGRTEFRQRGARGEVTPMVWGQSSTDPSQNYYDGYKPETPPVQQESRDFDRFKQLAGLLSEGGSAGHYHFGFDPEENPPRLPPRQAARSSRDVVQPAMASGVMEAPDGTTPEDVAQELVSTGAEITEQAIDQAVLEAGVLDDDIPDFADRVWEAVDQIQSMGTEIPQIDEGVNIDGLITMLEQGDPLVVSDLSKAFKAAPGQEIIINTELADDAAKAAAGSGTKKGVSSALARGLAKAAPVSGPAAALAGGLETGDLALKHGGAAVVPGAENYSLFSQKGLEGLSDAWEFAKEYGPAIVSGAKNLWDASKDYSAPEGGLDMSDPKTQTAVASPGGGMGPMGWTLEESHLNQIIREELASLLSESPSPPLEIPDVDWIGDWPYEDEVAKKLADSAKELADIILGPDPVSDANPGLETVPVPPSGTSPTPIRRDVEAETPSPEAQIQPHHEVPPGPRPGDSGRRSGPGGGRPGGGGDPRAGGYRGGPAPGTKGAKK